MRSIFREAFSQAGLTYFTPHSFRSTLAIFGERVCRTPEQFKAWSQNLGHESCLTTFSSYGTIPPMKQAEIIRRLGEREPPTANVANVALLRRLLDKMERGEAPG